VELAVQTLGADRLMLGTDYPILQDDWVAETIAKAQINAAERELVLHGTAQSVIARLT
jgi:predicted TIM-barrel fold metal-dependent hydrolase